VPATPPNAPFGDRRERTVLGLLTGRPGVPDLLEDPGGGMQPCALARRQSSQHRVAHQSVLELERADVPQDPGAHELLAERRGLLEADAGQPRGGDERRVLEHRDGVREPDRTVAQARERRADRSRDRVRPEACQRGRVGLGTSHRAWSKEQSHADASNRTATGALSAAKDEESPSRATRPHHGGC